MAAEETKTGKNKQHNSESDEQQPPFAPPEARERARDRAGGQAGEEHSVIPRAKSEASVWKIDQWEW
jgi:hypothetical protein